MGEKESGVIVCSLWFIVLCKGVKDFMSYNNYKLQTKNYRLFMVSF